MEIINTNHIDTPGILQTNMMPVQPGWQPIVPVPAPQFTTLCTKSTTLTIASAFSIGFHNMVDVQNGAMSIPQAILNGLAKGAAASLILNATARSTALQVVMAAGVLAGTGYLVDSAM